MKIPLSSVLNSISSWRDQVAQAIEAPDPRSVLRHLDATMQQAEEILRQASRHDDAID